ncbi:hypothetical protein PHYPSEUDO_001196 [Phytophthora pseudosyringae]|uniref:Uncharacterized protein n=1 Tax=Phytophthora pseudosyringae TaxID=221518 RepID=A0A8T1W0Z5_9STRA|nr:hypothetical protein PHYPSEUDO_001196 [Phytophthora pseudosyringae]
MAIIDASALRKEDRYATIADAIAVVETFAEQTQRRHARVQQPKPSSNAPAPAAALGFSSSSAAQDEASSVPAASASSNAVILECENAPGCKWFVRLSFVKGEKKWKISSMNTAHHKTHCAESKQAVAANALGFASSMATEQLLASANAGAAVALTAASAGVEAAVDIGASVYAGMVFVSWKEAIGAIRALAHQMGRRAMAEKAAEATWRGKSVMARRVMCQNHRNSNCGWVVVLEEATAASDRYTVLSMSLLHSKECLETCNFNARKEDAPALTAAASRGENAMGATASSTPLGSLVDDVSKYQLTHEMRWSTGKEATKAISDFALVVQRKRAKLL